MFSNTLILELCQPFRHPFSSSYQAVCKHGGWGGEERQGNALLTVLEEDLVSEAGVGDSG